MLTPYRLRHDTLCAAGVLPGVLANPLTYVCPEIDSALLVVCRANETQALIILGTAEYSRSGLHGGSPSPGLLSLSIEIFQPSTRLDRIVVLQTIRVMKRVRLCQPRIQFERSKHNGLKIYGVVPSCEEAWHAPG